MSSDHTPLRVLSLGAGVQSTAMALMANDTSVLPTPDIAVFADTGGEPQHVYQHVAWLERHVRFPVLRVGPDGPDLTEQLLTPGRDRYTSIPAFTSGGGIGRRQCTKEHKITPVRNAVRAHLGYSRTDRPPAGVAELWIGISTDEASRMKDSDRLWIPNRYPLIELGFDRGDCMAWLARHGYQIPDKSSCVYCPYHGNDYWDRLKHTDKAGFALACRVDEAIREREGMHERQYLHRSLVPLKHATFSEGQLDLWDHECEAGCYL